MSSSPPSPQAADAAAAAPPAVATTNTTTTTATTSTNTTTPLDPSFFPVAAQAAAAAEEVVVQALAVGTEEERQQEASTTEDTKMDADGATTMSEAELLAAKDLEIKQLKLAIVHQHKEMKRLKSQLSQATGGKLPAKKNQHQAGPMEYAIEGIANQSLSSPLGSGRTSSGGGGGKVEAKWKNRFQQLVAYKLEHGDCNVPQSYKDKSLHAWVRTQREAKKDFDKRQAAAQAAADGTAEAAAAVTERKGCKMTQERVDALNSLGFQWVVGHQPNDAAWEGMFQALLQYKQQHGHTRVSASENKQLYKWVLNQRARRRLLETNGEGKAKGMTWARVEKLSAIDFCWEASSNRRRSGGNGGGGGGTPVAAAAAAAALAEPQMWAAM